MKELGGTRINGMRKGRWKEVEKKNNGTEKPKGWESNETTGKFTNHDHLASPAQ